MYLSSITNIKFQVELKIIFVLFIFECHFGDRGLIEVSCFTNYELVIFLPSTLSIVILFPHENKCVYKTK